MDSEATYDPISPEKSHEAVFELYLGMLYGRKIIAIESNKFSTMFIWLEK